MSRATHKIQSLSHDALIVLTWVWLFVLALTLVNQYTDFFVWLNGLTDEPKPYFYVLSQVGGTFVPMVMVLLVCAGAVRRPSRLATEYTEALEEL